uniref:C-type lectin domain-containing protein n=1 Tax=Seriola lalandi dorsalis TaxID=1841481 RepID=A0A3B4XF78_SERLL
MTLVLFILCSGKDLFLGVGLLMIFSGCCVHACQSKRFRTSKYFSPQISFVIIVHLNLTWEDAFDYCADNHKSLLQIEDSEDQKAVEQWLNYTTGDGPFWIGLRQSRVFGFWIWRDKTVSYSNWMDGRQPEMPISDNCGVINKTDYKWRDENCWHEHPFICEEEISFMNK